MKTLIAHARRILPYTVAPLVAHSRWILGYDGIPQMARPTFRYDLISNLFASIALGVIFPSLAAQFARRGLQASTWLVGFIYVLMPMGNFLNTFLAQRLSRARRVPLIVRVRIVMGLFVGAIAFLPSNPGAGWWFVGLLLVPSVLFAITLNVQNSVRHSNYPAAVRGTIFGRITIMRMGGMAASALLAGYALDRYQWGHRLVYTIAACALLLAAWFYSRIRIRRERTMLRNGARTRINLLDGFRLLVKDRAYGQFMGWQMVFGFMNLMSGPVLVLVMTDYLKVDYQTGTTALMVVPLGVAVFGGLLAGRLFDHLKVTHFRSVGATFWGASKIVVFLGAITGSWALVLLGFGLQGLGQAMGSIAFNIGHTQFASVDRSQEYMGIHLTLQGIRGMVAPMLTAALLTQFGGSGLMILPVAGCVMLVTAVGFFFTRPPETPGAAAAAEDAFRRARDGL